MHRLGCRLMAGQRILVPSMGVRLPPSQPLHLLHMARSSSGLGRRPLKAEITSSNLVRATNSQRQAFGSAVLHANDIELAPKAGLDRSIFIRTKAGHRTKEPDQLGRTQT